MNVIDYFEYYQNSLVLSLFNVDKDKLEQVTDILLKSSFANKPVFVFGNGGSAAISEHFSCDHSKGISHDTNLTPNVISLSSNLPLITAIANDYSYDEIFSKQLEYFPDFNGVAIGISSSGNSTNILKGLQKAKDKKFTTIAFVGFDGGKVVSENLADYILHVPCHNYGIVEDSHQILMHIIAQFIRDRYNSNKHPLKL